MAKGAGYSREEYRRKLNLDGQRRAFVTGSQAYGNPRPDSDVDLVIRCDDVTRNCLARLADSVDPAPHDYKDNHSLRFGSLNIICVVDNDEYDIWADGTERLIAKAVSGKTVTRDMAVALFAKLRRHP